MSSEFHRLFNLIMPENLPTEAELQAMTRPLALCSTCHSVLCSCGNCHNTMLCNEPCLYETQTEEEES